MTRSRTAALAACLALALTTAACGKGDADEKFRLWSNNEAGWQEMGSFVADRANSLKDRARALEVLIDEGGQPSQAIRVASKAPDKVELLLELQPALQKMLENPNPKKQGHAKRVLLDMLSVLPDDKKEPTRKMVAKWAFGDLSHDDQPTRVKEKLEQRIRPEEIEALGAEGVQGASIMLGKGIARDGVLEFLKTQKTPEAKAALIEGLRRYHTSKKNVKVSETDLAAIQGTDSVEGFLYFLELYERLLPSEHPDDKAAANLAIQAAIQWTEKPEAKEMIKASWAKVDPVMGRLIAGKNCDDRWWAAQMYVTYRGVEGVKEAFAKLPDDAEYGQSGCAQNDVKLMITDLCNKDIKLLGAEAVRPVLEQSLKSGRMIERILAIRCLTGLGDPVSVGLLKAVDKKDPVSMRVVDPVIVPPFGQNLAVYDLAAIGAEIAEYHQVIDKQAAEGKIDAATAKWRKHYASYSFDRHTTELAAFAEEMAADKVAKDKAKAPGAAAP